MDRYLRQLDEQEHNPEKDAGMVILQADTRPWGTLGKHGKHENMNKRAGAMAMFL